MRVGLAEHRLDDRLAFAHAERRPRQSRPLPRPELRALDSQCVKNPLDLLRDRGNIFGRDRSPLQLQDAGRRVAR